jgi:hypothetical protein
MGPIDSQHRYLIHFDDGGSGMRQRDERLRPGDVLSDGGVDYVREPTDIDASNNFCVGGPSGTTPSCARTAMLS